MASFGSFVGRAIRGMRPGIRAAAFNRITVTTPLRLASSAFSDGEPMPVRFTADGAGVSPPFEWSALPPNTMSMALLAEDVDAPLPRPIVHLLLHGIAPSMGGLAEGAIPIRLRKPTTLFEAGRNSYFRCGWLPPSPVPGHGPHRYVFQLFALRAVPGFSRVPGRAALLRAMAPLVLAQGQIVGTYERP